jgi:hypothetical protein
MRRGLEPIDRRRDSDTGLTLATYGPPNSDVACDFAVPETTAHPYFNALYVEAYREYAEIAEALGDGEEARRYRAKGDALQGAINRSQWVPARSRYETRIVRSPVSTDTELAASRITEDTRFPVVDNMLLLYYGVVDSPERTQVLVNGIEASQQHLALAGQMVTPPYPDRFMSRAASLFDGGNYHNGDVWTWFSNRYAIALYRLGYPEEAFRHLEAQARAAVRDGGFCEYYEDDGVGRPKGAFHYAPTAATFQLAVIEGLFGIRYDAPAGTLQLHPSVRKSGRIRLRVGGRPLEYKQHFSDGDDAISIEIDAPCEVTGDFRVLLPGGDKRLWHVRRRTGDAEEPIPAAALALHDDYYLVFQAPLRLGRQVFELQPAEEAHADE